MHSAGLVSETQVGNTRRITYQRSALISRAGVDGGLGEGFGGRGSGRQPPAPGRCAEDIPRQHERAKHSGPEAGCPFRHTGTREDRHTISQTTMF